MEPHQQQHTPQFSPFHPPVKRSRGRLFLIITLAVLVLGALFIWWLIHDRQNSQTGKTNTTPKVSTEAPTLDIETVLSGREHIWEIAFLPTKVLLFSERKGALNIVKDGAVHQLTPIDDVYARGEGGLMGLAVDPQFTSNRYLYSCFASTHKDIRVVRWKLGDNLTTLSNRTDIITGIPLNETGRHSGCRIAFGPDGYLWVGTGDSAQDLSPQPPQDPQSLGGKILRVDRDGRAAPGNNGGAFDARIYSYGHRNTQGLAFFPALRDGVPGISVEHGSSVDDELNPLKTGNFGWAPPNGPYNENVSMTDTKRFPNAVNALWSSGDPTLAPSGAAVLTGTSWKGWNGAVAVAMLKSEHLRIFLLDDKLKVTKEEIRLADEYGRLRAVTLGPDGLLYVGTSNGTDDQILRIKPY